MEERWKKANYCVKCESKLVTLAKKLVCCGDTILDLHHILYYWKPIAKGYETLENDKVSEEMDKERRICRVCGTVYTAEQIKKEFKVEFKEGKMIVHE